MVPAFWKSSYISEKRKEIYYITSNMKYCYFQVFILKITSQYYWFSSFQHMHARCFSFRRFSLVFLFGFWLYVGKCSSIIPSPTPSPPFNNFHNKCNIFPKRNQVEINNYDIFQIFILASGFSSLLWMSLLQLCKHLKYVTFNTNLYTRRKETTAELPDCFPSYLSFIMLGLLLCECPDYTLLISITSINSSCGSIVNLTLKFSKIVSQTIFSILSIYIYTIAHTPATCILCLMVFQIWCHSLKRNIPLWLPIILILLSNDNHLNPGPHFQNNFFNFMSWNVNPLTKGNFQRTRLIEAHNMLFIYDLISICETSLNDSVDLPETLINYYTFSM